MKKLIMTLVLAGVMVSVSACGNTGSSETVSEVVESENVQTVAADAVKDDRVDFKELPDEANSAFNTVINAVKDICPVEKGFNRQYGYKGKEKIDGVECYLFSVYDFDKDNGSIKVGDFAKAVNEELVYKIDGTGIQQIELTPDKYKLDLSNKGVSAEKMLKNAASLAAEMIISG